MGYTKLFSSLIHSTIWREDDKTRILWVTMLAISDFDGRVEASIPGLADAARMEITECEAGLKVLMSPDPYSRSQEYEGRRISEVDGGWIILNHAKYRDKHVSRADYYRKWREEKGTRCATVAQQICNTAQQSETHTETETETETETDKKESPPTPQRGRRSFEKPSIQDLESYKQEIGFSSFDPQAFLDFYESKGWFVGKNKMKCWKSAVRTWQRRTPADKQTKMRLFPISGRVCGKCGMPAVYKSTGEFDHYYCGEHMPQKVREKYSV
jgi:hypothetical protein